MGKKCFYVYIVALWVCVGVLSFSGKVYGAESSLPAESSDLLWLVNQDNRLAPDYEPPVLVTLEGYRMHPAVGEAYTQMLTAMKAAGIRDLHIQSAYRSYSYQQLIFNNKKMSLLGLGYDEDTAIALTARSIAFPGASEHQTGLALDVTLDGTLNQSFGDTEAGRWINENCYRFGFIVRYQSEKTDITRIIYEPWHLRYVGNPHALFMQENDLCYEEYIAYLQENRNYIYWDSNGVYYRVTYSESPPLTAVGQSDVSAACFGEGTAYIVTRQKAALQSRLDELSFAAGRLPKNW